MKTHWHIKTIHHNQSPDYPSKDAIYIYSTACAKELVSTYQNKDYKITQIESELEDVDCKPCTVWAKAYFKQNTLIDGHYIFKRKSEEENNG